MIAFGMIFIVLGMCIGFILLTNAYTLREEWVGVGIALVLFSIGVMFIVKGYEP